MAAPRFLRRLEDARRLASRSLVAAASLVIAACWSSTPPFPPRPHPPHPPPALVAPPEPAAPPLQKETPPPETDDEREIRLTLDRVAEIHGLDIKRPVAGRVISRAEGIRLIIERSSLYMPTAVLQGEGEMAAALGLSPPDYAIAKGIYGLIEANVAGFYDPKDGVMFLVDDLDPVARTETLVHELVHALQDQHFDLDRHGFYRPGQLDRRTAESCLAEGGAMSATFQFSHGAPAFVDPHRLRLAMRASTALSTAGASTPRVFQASLVAPYVDGLAFVQALRKRGGWAEVVAAWKSPPETTEQILHLDKYDAREPALDIPPLPWSTLGESYRPLSSDTWGELGLRTVLEQWTTLSDAAEAAAGWGGDRYLVLTAPDPAGDLFAVGWHLRFDTVADAAEAADIVAKHAPRCTERDPMGPIAWRRRGADLAIVAGPYRRVAGSARREPTATCALATRWIGEILSAR